MYENRILEMFGELRAEMFDLLDGEALSMVLDIIDKRIEVYRGLTDEEIAKCLLITDYIWEVKNKDA